jgi:small GTP-binding protein
MCDAHLIVLRFKKSFQSLSNKKVMNNDVPSSKVIVIGDSDVGKTCLIRRAVKNTFGSTTPTIGIDFEYFHHSFENGAKIKLQIWDTAGQERFRTITKSYYHQAAATLFVFDLTDALSFDNIKKWMVESKEYSCSDSIYFLVANKLDMGDERLKSKQEGEDLAQDLKAAYFEVSALDGTGVEELFVDVAKKCYKANKFQFLSQPIKVTRPLQGSDPINTCC